MLRRIAFFSSFAVRAMFAMILSSSITACAVAGSRPASRAFTSPGSRAVMRRDEIPQQGSVYEAIQALRPEFFRPRAGTHGLGEPVFADVYIDGALLANPGMLRLVQASWAREIRYIPAHATAAQFGRRHEAGVILVTTEGRSP